MDPDGNNRGYVALEFICDVETGFGKKKGSPVRIFWRRLYRQHTKQWVSLPPALKDWVPKDEIALIRNGEERG